MKSSAAAAFLLFGCVNYAFGSYVSAGKFDRLEASQHRETYWEIKQYRKLTAPPDVLMIGSSLLVRLITDGEATYLNKPINSVTHKQSVHFEDAVQRRTGVRPSTFAFDLHGLHASDAAVVLNGVIGQKAPSTIIYTIAPRDFVDNMLKAPDTTEQFKLMSRISELNELKTHAAIHSMDKFEFNFVALCSKFFATVRCRAELASAIERAWRRELIPALAKCIAHSAPPRELYLGVTPFDYPEVSLIAPESPGSAIQSNNMGSYEICYQPFRLKNYNAQLFYLDHLLNAAKSHGSKVILVNMPLRKDNLSAMQPGVYRRYKRDMQQHALQHGAKFVDLFANSKFVNADFMDSVHLTGHGAIKLVEVMADAIAPDVAAQTIANRAESKNDMARSREVSDLASHELCRKIQTY